MNATMLRRLLIMLAAISLAVGLAACSDDDDAMPTTGETSGTPVDSGTTTTPIDSSTTTPIDSSTTTPIDSSTTTPIDSSTTTPAADVAEIRAIHLAPGADAVELRLADTGEVITDEGPLAFGSALGFAYELPSGTYDIEVVQDGAVIETLNVTVTAPNAYSIAAVLDGEGDVIFLVEEDDYSFDLVEQLGDDEQTRLTGIHAAAGVPTVDVYARELGSTDDPTLLFEGIEFGNRGAFQDVDSASYEILLDIDQNGEYDFIFIPAAPLSAGYITNAYVVMVAGSPVVYAHVLQANFVLPVGPATGDLRILHAAENAGSVDVWVDGMAPEADSPLAGIEFGDATDYLPIPAGQRTIALYAAGEDDEAVFTFEPYVAPGLVATAIAHGDASEDNTDAALAFTVTISGDDAAEIDEDDTRLTFFHAAFGAGEATVSAEADPDPIALFTDIAYGASDTTDVETDLYTLIADVDGDTLLFSVDLDGLEDTLVYAVATFDEDGDVVLLLLWGNDDGESTTMILEGTAPVVD